MKTKKIPMRMCAGCRESKPKKELLRVVKTPSGEICFDRTGKLSGRGAYVCASAACLAKCKKTKALARALETDISEDIFATLEKDINENS